MALDVYVGSLTRYYAGDWENVAEKSARAPGRPHRPSDGSRRVAGLEARVLAWRATLGQSLGPGVAGPFDWDEALDAPYFTGRPGWDGFGSLVLWAAYVEHPALRLPASLPEEWDDDPALVRCKAEGFRSRSSHLVRNVELWLPSAFPFTFEGEDVDGRRIVIGSAMTLSRQLDDLNAATWKVGVVEAASWGRRPPTPDAALELRARYAFAVLMVLVGQAVENRLPMKLNY